MNPKKEHYRINLPHFQQPGQWYFITCMLQNAVPKHAMEKYSHKLSVALFRYKNTVNNKSDPLEIVKYKREYLNLRTMYFHKLDDLMNKTINGRLTLDTDRNRKIIEGALRFWEEKRLHSHAWCIMPNHLHWVVSINKLNEKRESVYLQDVLHSIKSFTAHQLNKNEGISGQVWMHESFDTTIRGEDHFNNVIDYTVNNPVKAGFVKNWEEWPGTFIEED